MDIRILTRKNVNNGHYWWQEYHLVNQTSMWGNGLARLHAGLHLVVLHQYTGRLMTAESFTTWQMTSDAAFLSAFHNIQDGRLILILGAVRLLKPVHEQVCNILVSITDITLRRATSINQLIYPYLYQILALRRSRLFSARFHHLPG